ncbi:pantothenate kinase 1 isoform X4 [Populus trichocarpa]|uniref:pantothenate kinase 1 isoform X4 n=1 Tax=Populus trichocarpa TaxID=3694 RepID=UPI000D18B672|nr:pantothenate kinase 1 isoform X4 [Populus trichocarpa]|eukprot:XP_024466303.1 pantothenate kinase 1 isoform X4 [Populus trichocarpa]
MDRLREIETDGNSNPIQISRLALDIGGSLIKLVYFSRDSGDHEDPLNDSVRISNGVNGRLHFAKFETTNINDCLQFISANKLFFGGFQHQENPTNDRSFIKATGGGAYKFSDLFKEKLGISLEKEDEMDCLVTGANFLLKAVNHEAFTYLNGQKEFVQIDHNDLYPYLLVNIGSGVSMIKVDGDGKFERVSGTSVGGGTFWGLGKLLTKCQSFDELLELSQRGNNRVLDMLVGDIYGGMEYSKISYLNALRFGLKRIFFGGFFTRGHSYTMDTISVAVHFWSKGEAKAMFLRHEGFLGALGAFMSYERHSLGDLMVNQSVQIPVDASSSTDTNYNPLERDLNETESMQCSVYQA